MATSGNKDHLNPNSPLNKQMKKFIVALKTTDQRESIDYLLT